MTPQMWLTKDVEVSARRTGRPNYNVGDEHSSSSNHENRTRPMAKQLPEDDTPSPKEDVDGPPLITAPTS